MSHALISSSFENRTFSNRSRIINLLANNTQIDNLSVNDLDNQTMVLLSLNIRNSTVNNNNLTFKINDFEAFIWNDRQLNGQNNQNFSIKLNEKDKIQVIKNIYDNKLMGKYSVYNNNVNTQLNLMYIENKQINLQTVFTTMYDYTISDIEITLSFKPDVKVLYDGTIEEVNIPDDEYPLITCIFDTLPDGEITKDMDRPIVINTYQDALKFFGEIDDIYINNVYPNGIRIGFNTDNNTLSLSKNVVFNIPVIFTNRKDNTITLQIENSVTVTFLKQTGIAARLNNKGIIYYTLRKFHIYSESLQRGNIIRIRI